MDGIKQLRGVALRAITGYFEELSRGNQPEGYPNWAEELLDSCRGIEQELECLSGTNRYAILRGDLADQPAAVP